MAKEYIKGKRVKYLHPIRMYLFTSAIFFLIFVNFSNHAFTSSIKVGSDTLSYDARKSIAETLQDRLKDNPRDTALKKKIVALLDTSRQIHAGEVNSGALLQTDEGRYRSLETYDSTQKALPPSQRDNWFKRRLARQGLAINEKFKENRKETIQELSESFLHKAPYMLFISLPFFALILKLLYVRRKKFYYSDHAVFTLYHYIFSFIVLLIVLVFNGLGSLTHWKILNTLITFIFIGWFVYSYLEMHNFYQQGYFKTAVKFLLLNFLAFITVFVLFIGFLLIVFLQM